MATFIRAIGRCAVNGISFDVYENKDGSATVRPVQKGTDFPRPSWRNYESLEELENTIDKLVGEDLTGASRVQKLKEIWL